LLARLCRWYVEAMPEDRPGVVPPTDRMQSIRAALSLVEARYARKLELDDLARAEHLQRNHFCRIFRRATGLPPMTYVNHLRVQKARELLCHSDRSITEIGAAVGFYDTAHFSRSFRKIQGESPTACRKRLKRSGR
jgi:transcriptional regulator GlxA family with amidase domain